MFEVYLKIIFDMKNIYDNDVNNIDELSLLHDILNLSKLKKKSHYSPILHGFINTRRDIEKYKIQYFGWYIYLQNCNDK